jgi:hypothetical protein
MDCDGDSEHREGQKEQRQEQAASDFKTCSTAWRRPSWEVLRLCCVWLFSQSGQDVRSECAIAPAEDRARAPCWALAGPSQRPRPFWPRRSFIPPTVSHRTPACMGCHWLLAQCCAVALLGWAGLQTAGQQGAQGAQGAVPLLKITACMGV